MKYWKGMHILTIAELDRIIDEAENVAIYGAGNYGKGLIDYLIFRKRVDKVIGILVTEKEGNDSEYKGISVLEAGSFLNHEDCAVIVAAALERQEGIVEMVERYGKNYCCLTPDVYATMLRETDIRKKVSYQGLNFLMPGFAKCGTTSLYKILKIVNDIYLSEIKESLFFRWQDKVKDAEKVLVENYFGEIREGQIVGAIEPSFATRADSIYDVFGSQIKLFFVVRNPVDAVFSNFKMMLRYGSGDFEDDYRRYGHFSMDMFNDFYDKYNDTAKEYCYINWIEEFRKYYQPEQIRIIFFEELVKNTNVVIKEILQFIGSEYKYECSRLPFVNEGNYVMADLEGYLLARQNKTLFFECRIDKNFGNDFEDREEKYKAYMHTSHMLDKAKRVYSPKMSAEQRRNLKNYYNDSVRELEKFLDKDLSGLWF